MIAGSAKYVNLSALETGVVPPGVTTLTSTGPTACTGAFAEIRVSLITVNAVAGAVPNLTELVPVNPVPSMTTAMPLRGPTFGVTRVMLGAAAYTNLLAELDALRPPGPVTITSTVPGPCAGAIATSFFLDFTVNEAELVPNDTPETPANPDPVIVTGEPPRGRLLDTLSAVTAGTATKVNDATAVDALRPPDATTLIFATPALRAGVTAVILVELTTVICAAGVAPNLTAVTPTNPVPLRETSVPPVLGPDRGLTPVTVGLVPRAAVADGATGRNCVTRKRTAQRPRALLLVLFRLPTRNPPVLALGQTDCDSISRSALRRGHQISSRPVLLRLHPMFDPTALIIAVRQRLGDLARPDIPGELLERSQPRAVDRALSLAGVIHTTRRTACTEETSTCWRRTTAPV